ncbi:uncharacterized protein LOC111244568 [Varroa destructor]|uniref:BTB domain-containing protein n=1 Tax=Varroa destructor TaxID=109461 RepID=A0A7M7J6K5_VARDE|nr:uncharacterized protein LOC111244568 [Varroa destructor]
MGGFTSRNRYRSLPQFESKTTNEAVPAWETWCTTLFRHRLYNTTLSQSAEQAQGSSRFEVEEISPKILKQLSKARRGARFKDGLVMLLGSDGAVKAHLKVLFAACWYFSNVPQYSYCYLNGFTKKGLTDLVNFIYHNELPSNVEQLLGLNQLAEHIRYKFLAAQTSKLLIEQYEAEGRGDQALPGLLNLTKKFSLPTLYDHLCVALARYTQVPSVLLRVSPAVLTDVLVQDCLAVDDEDQVASLVNKFYHLHPEYSSTDVASCVRYNFLSESAKRWFDFESGIVWAPRHAYTGHYLSVNLHVRRDRVKIACILIIDRVSPGRRPITICTIEDSSGYDTVSNSCVRPRLDHVAGAKEAAEYRSAVHIASVTSRRLLFVRLGSTVLRVDLYANACQVLSRDIAEFYVTSEGLVKTVNRLNGKETLITSRAHTVMAALLVTPCDRLVVKLDIDYMNGKMDNSYTNNSICAIDNKSNDCNRDEDPLLVTFTAAAN